MKAKGVWRYTSPSPKKQFVERLMKECPDEKDVRCKMEKTFVPATMLLTLELVEGKDLHPSDTFTGNDAYCEIVLLDGTRDAFLAALPTLKDHNEAWPVKKYEWKTNVVEDDNNPKFNYKFS